MKRVRNYFLSTDEKKFCFTNTAHSSTTGFRVDELDFVVLRGGGGGEAKHDFGISFQNIGGTAGYV